MIIKNRPDIEVKNYIRKTGFLIDMSVQKDNNISVKSIEIDCSNSVNTDWIQVLSNSKYSLLFLLVVEIESETSKCFHSEALFNQMPYPQCYVSLMHRMYVIITFPHSMFHIKTQWRILRKQK